MEWSSQLALDSSQPCAPVSCLQGWLESFSGFDVIGCRVALKGRVYLFRPCSMASIVIVRTMGTTSTLSAAQGRLSGLIS